MLYLLCKGVRFEKPLVGNIVKTLELRDTYLSRFTLTSIFLIVMLELRINVFLEWTTFRSLMKFYVTLLAYSNTHRGE